MGEKHNQPFQLSFNAASKIDLQGSRVTSDGGLILVRELDERLGLGQLIEQHLSDPRRGKNNQFPVVVLNQIRSRDRRRLVKRLGRASAETMSRVDRALQISLGLIQV